MARVYRSKEEIKELLMDMKEGMLILERTVNSMDENDIDGMDLHSNEIFQTQWPRVFAWLHKLPWEISQIVRAKRYAERAADNTQENDKKGKQ